MSQFHGFGDRYVSLVKKLSESSTLRKLDRPNERGAETFAHALLDMSESFKKVESELLPKIERAEHDSEIEDAIFQIREEVRHILYHVKDAGLFEDILEGIKD